MNVLEERKKGFSSQLCQLGCSIGLAALSLGFLVAFNKYQTGLSRVQACR